MARIELLRHKATMIRADNETALISNRLEKSSQFLRLPCKLTCVANISMIFKNIMPKFEATSAKIEYARWVQCHVKSARFLLVYKSIQTSPSPARNTRAAPIWRGLVCSRPTILRIRNGRGQTELLWTTSDGHRVSRTTTRDWSIAAR